jgi:hypothetical protein
LTVSPRFFLLGLVVAVITAVLTIEGVATFLARRLGLGEPARVRLGAAAVLALAALSLASLRAYYATPKQPYRASIRYLAEERRPGEIVVAIHTARRGYEYYGPAAGLEPGRDLFAADSAADFERILAERGRGGALIATTFPRALHLVHPDLEATIDAGWVVARRFPATIGDGHITAWIPRDRPAR